MVVSSDVFRLVIQDAFLEADKEGNGAISLEELRIVSSRRPAGCIIFLLFFEAFPPFNYWGPCCGHYWFGWGGIYTWCTFFSKLLFYTRVSTFLEYLFGVQPDVNFLLRKCDVDFPLCIDCTPSMRIRLSALVHGVG